MAELLSRKMFAGVGSKRGNKKVNIFEKIDIKKIINKDTVIDIFKNIDQDPSSFRPQGFMAFMAYKFGYKRTKALYNKILLILSLNITSNSLFLKLLLERIKLSKDILMFEIEQGRASFISHDLSMDQLPPSFRFYDSLIIQIQDKLAPTRREFHALEKSIALRFLDQNVSNDIMLKLQGKAEKLTCQYSTVDKKDMMELDHHKSPYSMDV